MSNELGQQFCLQKFNIFWNLKKKTKNEKKQQKLEKKLYHKTYKIDKKCLVCQNCFQLSKLSKWWKNIFNIFSYVAKIVWIVNKKNIGKFVNCQIVKISEMSENCQKYKQVEKNI